MSHVTPASWQHWSSTLKKGKSTFKETDKVGTSRTLYITNLPHQLPLSDIEALFRQIKGFLAARRVRGMAFVDFDSKQDATNALERFKGHKFKPGEKGIMISYDKDDQEDRGGTSKRQMEELRRQKAELEASYCRLFCTSCGHFCCKLTTPLNEMPIRKTDNSTVVVDVRVVTLDMAKGEAKAIKREKGVERQYRLNCVQCNLPLAYRSVPMGKPGKYLYLMNGAVTDKKYDYAKAAKSLSGKVLAGAAAVAAAGDGIVGNAGTTGGVSNESSSSADSVPSINPHSVGSAPIQTVTSVVIEPGEDDSRKRGAETASSAHEAAPAAKKLAQTAVSQG